MCIYMTRSVIECQENLNNSERILTDDWNENITWMQYNEESVVFLWQWSFNLPYLFISPDSKSCLWFLDIRIPLMWKSDAHFKTKAGGESSKSCSFVQGFVTKGDLM